MENSNDPWQSIETAPKDGTIVLVYRKGLVVSIGYYDSFIKDWSCWSYGIKDGVVYSFTPTHWKKLISGPIEE